MMINLVNRLTINTLLLYYSKKPIQCNICYSVNNIPYCSIGNFKGVTFNNFYPYLKAKYYTVKFRN